MRIIQRSAAYCMYVCRCCSACGTLLQPGHEMERVFSSRGETAVDSA